jgi:hypothetical protein
MSVSERVIARHNALKPEFWYDGPALSELWGVGPTKRAGEVAQLVSRNMMKKKGLLVHTRYQLLPVEGWRKPAKKTKLKRNDWVKEIPAATPSTLDELVNAVTKVGTENACLKQALRDIKNTLAKIEEYL